MADGLGVDTSSYPTKFPNALDTIGNIQAMGLRDSALQTQQLERTRAQLNMIRQTVGAIANKDSPTHDDVVTAKDILSKAGIPQQLIDAETGHLNADSDPRDIKAHASDVLVRNLDAIQQFEKTYPQASVLDSGSYKYPVQMNQRYGTMTPAGTPVQNQVSPGEALSAPRVPVQQPDGTIKQVPSIGLMGPSGNPNAPGPQVLGVPQGPQAGLGGQFPGTPPQSLPRGPVRAPIAVPTAVVPQGGPLPATQTQDSRLNVVASPSKLPPAPVPGILKGYAPPKYNTGVSADGSVTVDPSQGPELEAGTKAYQGSKELAANLASSSYPAKQIIQLLDKIGPNGTGVTTPEFQRLKSAAVGMGLISAKEDDKTVVFDKLNKYFNQFQLASGSKQETDYGRRVNEAGMPNIALTQPANRDLIVSQYGLDKYHAAMSNLFDKYAKDENGQPLNRGYFKDWMSKVGSKIDPRAFMVEDMTNEQLKTLAKGLKSSPKQAQRFHDSYNMVHGMQ